MMLKKILFILILLLAPVLFVKAALPVKPIRILIVPGHDDKVWGAEYGNLKEADMNLVLATQIYNLLRKDKRFQVYITRNSKGYIKTFQDYFDKHKDDIVAFKENAKNKTEQEVVAGNFVTKSGVPHMSVTEDIAIKLYGINKWADENKIDAMIHVHFDDFSRPDKWTIGDYKGFTVYMPDGELANSKNSATLAENIFTQLSKKYSTSTYKPESGGLIPDQKLIALGANDTLNASVRSVLIEYGYIYQKIFRNIATRHQAYKTMANLTATGIEDNFFKKRYLFSS